MPNYRVIRVEPSNGEGDDGQIVVVGDFPDLETALNARDDDVVLFLADCGGWYRIVAHWILESRPGGRDSALTYVSAAGVDPDRPRSPDIDDLLETRSWLAAIHDRRA